MTAQILILPGDGIGPEITVQAEAVLEVLRECHGLDAQWSRGLIGGSAVDAEGEPLPAKTLERARSSDAVLLAAVGGPRYDTLPREKRPERGLLAIRKGMGLYANLRPAILFPELADASALKPEKVSGLDILVVRELTGGIYFGSPRGIEERNGERVGFNTEVYSESEIRRIAHSAFQAARVRRRELSSVDKANVLESSELWRETVIAVSKEYPDVRLQHVLVDNAAMQLVRDPKQFDVLVTSNMFGDILSDIASQLTGSIGMLPSASLNEHSQGLYEPVHGSAPDITGKGVANPLAMILSVAMLLRYSLRQGEIAARVEAAVRGVLADGLRTADLVAAGGKSVGTQEMGAAVVAALRKR